MRIFLFLLLTSALAHATVYGTDDRVFIQQAPADFQQMRRSIAIMVPKNYVHEIRPGIFKLETDTLENNQYLCPQSPFAKEPTFFVNCTGTLVASDLLLTAGHCALNTGRVENTRTPMCEDFVWIFDFQKEGIIPLSLREFTSEQVIDCETAVFAENQSHLNSQGTWTYGLDIALLKISKKMQRPLIPISNPTLHVGEKISMVGYPLSLPLMYQPGKILSQENGYWRTNLDAFGGNSGSPVFNSQNQLFGVLVRGTSDSMILDRRQNCYQTNFCDENGTTCQWMDHSAPGEHVVPIPLFLQKLI